MALMEQIANYREIYRSKTTVTKEFSTDNITQANSQSADKV